MTGPRGAEEIILIDDHVVVACAPPDALACLEGPEAIAAWFDARRVGDRTTIRSSVGDLELHRDRQEWRPTEGVLTIDGTAGPVRFHAYFTLRATIRPDPNNYLHEVTELWAHVELGPVAQAHRAAAILRSAIRRGLDHLRLELDATP